MSNLPTLDQLKLKIEEFQSLSRVSAHLDDVKVKLVNKYRELEHVSTKVKKEEKDVKDLEKGGFKPLFYKILGDKEKQLENERQEYLAVSLKYNSLKEDIELLEFEKDLLLKKSLSYTKVKKEMENLKNQREQELLNSENPVLRDEVRLILSKHDQSILLGKELIEAFDAGEKAHKNLSALAQILGQALDWGRWGGRSHPAHAEMMKRNKMSEASRALAVTQRSLDFFAKEMADLGEDNMKFRLNFNELNKFTDYFLDNLITDWIIQQKIRNTLNSVLSVKDKISRIGQSLKREVETNIKEQKRLLIQRDKLILTKE